MNNKTNSPSCQFAKLWPLAEAQGWTLEQCGMGFYVTPPSHDQRSKWAATWNYISYEDKLIYVPHWFFQEMAALDLISQIENQQENTITDDKLKSTVPQILMAPKKKRGWGRWLKSFIW